jgi:hypothetical protein
MVSRMTIYWLPISRRVTPRPSDRLRVGRIVVDHSKCSRKLPYARTGCDRDRADRLPVQHQTAVVRLGPFDVLRVIAPIHKGVVPLLVRVTVRMSPGRRKLRTEGVIVTGPADPAMPDPDSESICRMRCPQ